MTERYEYALITLDDGELYSQDIREALGDVFDIGVNVLGLEGERVARAFIASGLSSEFERRNPVFVAGKSGTDLINHMLPFLGLATEVEPQTRLSRSVDYWVGYMLGYYQAKTGHKYSEIFKRFSYGVIAQAYWPLHEADDTKFLETFEGQWSQRFVETRLSQLRKSAGLSQSELARRSGVGLRSIQMYEQGHKNINHASGETLYRLSLALNCSMEDILEL